MLRPSQSTVQSQDSTTAADRASQRHSTLASSSISLFLANLRLLNLDLRNDWPDITVKTFDTRDAQQNQKRRIQCVEWALYRLFEVWDAETTRDVSFLVVLHCVIRAEFFAETAAVLSPSGAFAVSKSACGLVSMFERSQEDGRAGTRSHTTKDNARRVQGGKT